MFELKEKITKINKSKIFLILVFLFPVEGGYLLKGFPFNKKIDILFLITICLILRKINKKNALVFGIVFLVFKLIITFNNGTMWSICINDQLTPTQESFKYEYFENKCTKSFDAPLSRNKYTVKQWSLEYKNLNTNYQWMGGNAANFPIGYLNHSKFNTYDLRRDWLPFRLYATKDIVESEKLTIEYVGEVSITFLPSDKKIDLPKRYLNPLIKEIEIPNNTESVVLYYKFTNWKFKPLPEIKSGYPYEYYGRLIVDEGKNNNLKNISFLIAIIFIISNLKTLPINKYNLTVLTILITFVVLKYNEVTFPINVYSLIGYLLILYCFYNKSLLNPLLIFIILSYLIIDQPWDQLNFLIKPSGSDILTYENQARLILEGDGLRGGESVFWYSPGYRYALFLVHLIFGDGWLTSWQLILAICIYLLTTLNNRFNIATFVFSIFLLMDNVRSLFLFGMSETVGLLLVLISIYLTKKNNKLKTATLSLAFAVIIRPELIIFSLLFLILNIKNKSNVILFFTIQLLPILHNLYYGNSFVIYSTAGTYQRNIIVDILGNLNYLIFNPFDEVLLTTLGRTHVYIGFFIVFISVMNYLSTLRKVSFTNAINNNFIYGLLCLIPFLIYDPKLFYPRHVIIGICLISLYENHYINNKLNNLKTSLK